MNSMSGKEGTPTGSGDMMVGNSIDDEITRVQIFAHVVKYRFNLRTPLDENQDGTGGRNRSDELLNRVANGDG